MGTDKDLEKIVDQLMEEAPLESPSSNFTHLVMQQVAKEQASASYKPLISKRAIFVTVAILGALVVYVFTMNTSSAAPEGQYLQLLMDTRGWFSEKLPQLQFSKTFSYAVGVIGFMICFQTFILKRHFHNRWA